MKKVPNKYLASSVKNTHIVECKKKKEIVAKNISNRDGNK